MNIFNHYFQNYNVVSVRDFPQHCLLVLIEKCRRVLDKRGFVGLLLTDCSKSFNCTDHEHLFAKLHAYDFNITSTTDNTGTSVKNETISNSSNRKLLSIRFRFDDHVPFLYQKASQKLNALTRVPQYMNLAENKSIMQSFICSQFRCCPLVRMFHSRKINNRLNSLHESALRVVYRDYKAIFSELLSKDKSVTTYQRNLQLLATEI